MKPGDQVVLQKILSYCEDISDMIQQFGDSFEAFERQRAYQYAVGMCILQIGELVARLSDEAKNEMTGIPWRLIRGMRNFYAHNYERVKMNTIWQTMKEDIPALRERLQFILNNPMKSE